METDTLVLNVEVIRLKAKVKELEKALLEMAGVASAMNKMQKPISAGTQFKLI
jgi:hypothetical protein